MTIARIGFTTILSLGMIMGSAQISWGQLFGAGVESSTAELPAGEVQQAVGVEGDLGVVKQTSWPSIPLPSITMPQITMPRLWPSAEDDRPALLSPFIAGAAKVSEGSKKAWEGVKDMFSVSPSESTTDSPAASSQQKPSMWKRLISRSPQKERQDDGPLTVSDFLKQERLLP